MCSTFGGEMKVTRNGMTRLGLSLCFAFHSLILFYVTTGLHEIAYDQLDGKPLPAVAESSQIFVPIGVLFIIFPILVGFACWRCIGPVSPSFKLVLTHMLLLGFSIALFMGVLLATAFLTYMNGVRPVSGLRIAGNILIGIALIAVIVRSYLRPRRTEQAEPLKPCP